MNPARSEPLDYINFLVAAQKSFTCAEAARLPARRSGVSGP